MILFIKKIKVKNLPINTTYGLRIVARVPARVEDNHSVGANEINTQRTRSGRHQEQVDIGICIEFIYQFLAF